MKGHAECVGLLLERGADHAVADGDGWTALTFAAAGGHAGAVQRLLAGGANHAHADKDGKTALPVRILLDHFYASNPLFTQRFQRAHCPALALHFYYRHWAEALGKDGAARKLRAVLG